MRRKLVGLTTLVGLAMLLLLTVAPFAGANGGELFGHNNAERHIYKIDTSDGSGTALPSPTGVGVGTVMEGMATSRGPVEAPGDVIYPAGTHFGLLANQVVVVDTVTGVATHVVDTRRAIGGRGIAFGPDGVTLFLIEGSGASIAELSTIDTVTGSVAKVGDVEDADRDYPSLSLEFDPDTETFYAISRKTLVNIDPSDGSAAIVGGLGSLGFNACTLARSPNGTWFAREGISSRLVTIDIATGTKDSTIGGTGMTDVCGTVFAPVQPLTIVVDIDIKPNSDPNSYGCESRGSIPVALLGSSTFDATTIDADTVLFGATGTETDEVHSKKGSAKRHVEDYNADGFLDMIFHFDFQSTGFSCDDVPPGEKSVELVGIMTGKLSDGTEVQGEDILRLTGK